MGENGKAITNTKTKTSTGVYYASTTKKSLKNKKEQWQLKATDAFNKLQLKAYKKIKNASSNTRYAIAVDLKNHWLWVYERGSKSDPWSLKYEWRCSNGKKATPTPAVNRLTSGYKRYKNPQIKPDGQTEYQSSFYYMTYVDSGKYIHTPLYKKGSHSRYKDKRMGRSISNGCIRVKTPNAIWVYKHIKRGTRIITYYH
jgi:lipoprotein-anchoring transpeptidase ErfK/SrfK